MNEKLKHLDLFSGIGGFALGLESTGGFETVGFCDNEPFAQKVLKKHWPDVPIYEDVRDVGVETIGYRGVDIITGGFPCQSISVAGLQKATEDNRWLWPEMFRIIKEIHPTYIIGENVRNLISIREGVVFEQVCTDLEGEGYEVQTYVLSASSQNAPHQRYRCWIVAYANNTGQSTNKRVRQNDWNKKGDNTRRSSTNVADTNDNGHQRGCIETRNEITAGKNAQSIRRTSTKDFGGSNNDGRNRKEPISDGSLQGSRDDNKTRAATATGVRELSEGEHNNQGTGTEDGYQEDNNRALVSQGSKRVQPSIYRGLEQNQTLSEDDQVRQRDDKGADSRMDTKDVANSDSERQQEQWRAESIQQEESWQAESFGLKRQSWWSVEPSVGRVANGIPNRVDRLKGLGNAVVPQIPAVLGRAILEVHNG
jgi:DNA (cytosine-5)-methyltransferase 1|tara:strand:- start:550 stop:1821 length:1272 start_codon:yes stop_codon:yes gene_type:complete